MRQAQAELTKVFNTVYNMYDDPAEIHDALLDLVPAIARAASCTRAPRPQAAT